MNNNTRKNLPRRTSRKQTPLTKENLVPILEDIKDLIKSTAVATQTVLRKEMDERFAEVSEKFEMTWTAISEHTQQIKSLDNKVESLDKKVEGLDRKVESLDKKVEGLDKKIDNVETNLKEEMHQMEKRLSDKIDTNTSRLDNHESRILALERSS